MVDRDTEEYIDYLHDRIQFLEQELVKSHETILELKDEAPESRSKGILGELDQSLSGLEQQLNEDLDKLRDVSRTLEDYQEPDQRTKELFEVTDRLEDLVNDEDA